MKKQEILEKLNEKKGGERNAAKKERIDNICNMLRNLPDGDYEKKIPEFKAYLGIETSVLNKSEDELSADIVAKLKVISVPVYTAEGNALEVMNKKTRFFMNVFLAVIAALALAAVVLTVLNLAYGEKFLNGWGDKIAGALGTLDFALGALGFIIERRDDMNKKELHNAAEAAQETGDREKFDKIVIKYVTKNSNNKKIKAKNVGGDVFIGNKYSK